MRDRQTSGRVTPAGKLLAVLGIVIVLIPVCASLALLVPRAMGCSEFVVVTASMEPELPVGSLIITKEKDPASIQAGEVITFRSTADPEATVTHRVVENRQAEGQLITRGDANDMRDMHPVAYGDVIGVVTRSFPGLGFISEIGGDPKALGIMIAALVAGFILIIVGTSLRK